MGTTKAEARTTGDGLWQFFVLTFLFSWLMWLPGVLRTGDLLGPYELFPGSIQNAMQWIAGTGPSLVAIFLTFRKRGRKGLLVHTTVLDYTNNSCRFSLAQCCSIWRTFPKNRSSR
ncbi:MAG: hypothetical protein ACYS17_16965 [Planctomycetota bacterium]|jgi:hypothetical protein